MDVVMFYGALTGFLGIIVTWIVITHKRTNGAMDRAQSIKDVADKQLDELSKKVSRMESVCESCHIDKVETCQIDLKTRLGIAENNYVNLDSRFTTAIMSIQASILRMEERMNKLFDERK